MRRDGAVHPGASAGRNWYRGKSDRAGNCEFCFSPGRHRQLHQCTGPGIRSFPSGFYRRARPNRGRIASLGSKLYRSYPASSRPGHYRLVLRHTYGTVTAVASDGSSLTIAKDFRSSRPQIRETAVQSSHSLQILPDAANGTLYYDVDAKAGDVTIKSFSTLTARCRANTFESLTVSIQWQPGRRPRLGQQHV